MIKLTVLVENTAGNKCRAEHGLSYLVEADKPVLFDTGASDLFIQNAQQLNINLDLVETVVLSHGHNDQSGCFYKPLPESGWYTLGIPA